MSIRHELAEFCAETTFDALPDDIVQHSKVCLMDNVANMIVGAKVYSEDYPNIVKFIGALGGKKESTILGLGGKFPCLNAALANTTVGNVGFDAIHKNTVIHMPWVLLAATIAVAEMQKAGGRDLISAIVVGAETMIRVGISLGTRNMYALGFHPTSICGPFGCAVAAGRLLQLSDKELAESLSIAGVQAAGSSVWPGAVRPATARFQVGKAAQSGVMAAMLAQIGFTGIDKIFEDERGFLTGHSKSPDPAKLTEGLGERWEIKGLIFKRFAFGNLILTSVEALLEMLHKYEITADKIEEITLKLPTTIMPLVGSPDYPKNRAAALVNARYALAVNACMGDLAAYSAALSGAEARKKPQVISLFGRINIVGDPVLDEVFPDKEPCILTIKTKDGRQFSQRDDGPVKGDPDNPLSAEEIQTKFNRLITPILGENRANEIVSTIKQLHCLDDVSKLVDLWAR